MYFLLDVENVSDQAEEWLSHWAFDWGAQGISEVLSYHQEEGEEAVETVPSETHHLHVYFQRCPDPAFLQELKFRFPETRFQLREESDKDWLAEWKKGFHSFELVSGIYVVPSWLEKPLAATQVIWMEPGMAFGTGTHETTQMVAEQMAVVNVAGARVLDVGTGTGILAILAKRLGAEAVVGIDTESEALRVAAENALKNETKIDLPAQTLADVEGDFDIVVANIIDGILTRIQNDLMAKVRRPGWLILSGILEERERHFLETFHLPPGAVWADRRTKGDWICRVVRF